MSEIREPPKNLWWYCIPCGFSNGPQDTTFCRGCGRRKEDALDQERWDKFFTLDAEIADVAEHTTDR